MMRSIVDKYSLTPGVGVVVYDPATMLMAGSMGASALGTIAGAKGQQLAGAAANQSAQFSAAQRLQNAGQSIASSQRTMLDTQQRSRLLQSTAIARAGGSGVNAGVGSPVEDVGAIAKRGSYSAAMDLFRGMSNASGLENQAAGDIFSGQAAVKGSQLSAAGTIAGGVGSFLSQGGRFAFGGGSNPSYNPRGVYFG
jgi:hypothetical protein